MRSQRTVLLAVALRARHHALEDRMRQYLALALAVPVMISCSEAPSAPSLLEPEVGFVSNPPPPPVGGITFTFSTTETFAASPLSDAIVSAQPGSNAGDCTNIGGFCFPTRLFQNTTDNNTWLDFVKTSNLPKGIAKQLGCSQSPGRIQVKNGVATGEGCAWAQAGGLLLVIDLDQFDGLQGILDIVRASGNGPLLAADVITEDEIPPSEGELVCAAVVGPEHDISGRLYEGGELVESEFEIANLVFAPGGEGGNAQQCAPDPQFPEYPL